MNLRLQVTATFTSIHHAGSFISDVRAFAMVEAVLLSLIVAVVVTVAVAVV